MDKPKDPKKKYNTQELLSLNMDRLKEYMKNMGKHAADQENPPMFEVPPMAKSKSATRISKSPSACRLLALFEDPHMFVNLVSANDERPTSQRYGLDRSSDFADAMERMTRFQYDMILVAPILVSIEDVESPFIPVDWVLMLRGLMRPADVYFLAKKRWFVMNLVGGANNNEKVENFRAMKESYRNAPIIHLYHGDEAEAKTLDAAPKTRILPLDAKNFRTLFDLLDLLTYGG